jgi:hypothetical protein
MLHPTRLSLSMSGATPQAAQLPAVLKTSLVQAGRYTTYNAVTNGPSAPPLYCRHRLSLLWSSIVTNGPIRLGLLAARALALQHEAHQVVRQPLRRCPQPGPLPVLLHFLQRRRRRIARGCSRGEPTIRDGGDVGGGEAWGRGACLLVAPPSELLAFTQRALSVTQRALSIHPASC